MASRKSDNFVDKTFTIIADILLKLLPASLSEKEAFSYYRCGMSSYSRGDYAEALENYYESLSLEEDPCDRSYVLYNIALIYTNNGEALRALTYYRQSVDLNALLPQSLNNVAVICHQEATRLSGTRRFDTAQTFFEMAMDYWDAALRIAPNNYVEAQNWLRVAR